MKQLLNRLNNAPKKRNSFTEAFDLYLIILLLIAFFTHLQWFNPTSLLFSWDWKSWPDETIRNLFPFGQGAYINFFDIGVFVRLIFNGLQARIQELRGVIGGDDDGDQWRVHRVSIFLKS